MTGRAGTPGWNRWQTAITVGVLLFLGLSVIGAVVTTAAPGANASSPLQAEFQQNDTDPHVTDTDTNAPVPEQTEDVGALPPGQAAEAENESATFPPSEDAPGGSPTEQPAAEPQLVQGPEANVTVAVAENQSVRAETATTIALEVTNDGDRQATDIVVTLQSSSGALSFGSLASPRSSQSLYLEDLSSDETATVDVDVAALTTDPGTYPLFASVQYRVDEPVDDADTTADSNETAPDEDERVVTGGPSTLGIAVAEAPIFDLTPVGSDIPVDGEGVYEVRITNDGTETVSDVVATIDAGPPLSSESPTAYVGTLSPGDAETVRFAFESSPDAIETTAGVAMTLAYDTDDGDRTSSDPVSLPVSIVATDESTDADSLIPFIAVAIVFVLVGIWWFRRR
ncbi:COG1361 S-layer family protein [Natrialba asiatica]|uniref:Alpha-galactosidase NEW3 domain-containing protein n=1 Tax=Natrialba asiatica (strain ATCC 700177 / DSM 12278 / JCM 9576 / FERM P-10747 / NBRC 102637 / 172P1) TaxID=29540 RepID=M0B447_NATA1|nr:hypothetical protein [Natrialba asiatica]ELZ05686.1 hypothetical protein C481_01542 [Natrialba asiatica DSM 12278]